MTAELATNITELAPRPSSGLALSFAEMTLRVAQVDQFYREVMQEGTDYGRIGGEHGKPCLFQPGAQMLDQIFGYSPRFEILPASVIDWERPIPFFHYIVLCRLISLRSGETVAEGIGSCNSHEDKYRWRQAKRVCPACGLETIIKGKAEYGGGWLCFKKAGGCGAKFSDGDPAVEGQTAGRVENDDSASLENTISKMAQKRCLAGGTPMLFRTSRGETRGDIKLMYEIYSDGNQEIEVPGVDGVSWRRVEGMIRDEGRRVYRLDLKDGSFIRATGEHRFPTNNGLQSVEDLQVGDSLLRSVIELQREGKADTEYGWIAGLFIAEGHYDRKGVQFTLHEDETRYAERVMDVARSLGCSMSVSTGPGKRLDLTVRGPAFLGLMEQFVDGSGGANKHLSRRSWRQSPEFLQQMLMGYLAGDGSWTDRNGRQAHWRLDFTGQNRELADDLRAICAVLGYRHSLKRSNARFKEVEFPTFTGWIKTSVPYYHEADLEQIVSIERETKPMTVYDIQVDGDHLFCLANGIQTHNSHVAATLNATGASRIFTQDLEDLPQFQAALRVESSATTVTEPAPPAEAPASPASPAGPEQRARFEASWKKGVARAFACGVEPDLTPPPDATVDEWREALAELKAAVEARETLNAALLERIGTANGLGADFALPDPSTLPDQEVHDQIRTCDEVIAAAAEIDDDEAF